MVEKQYITEDERLKKIRLLLDLSRYELAKQFDVGENFYGQIESGRTIMTPQLMFLLAKTYNVNLNWIITGKGNLFVNDTEEINNVTENNIVSQNNIDVNAEISNLKKEVELLKQLILLKK